MVVLGQGRGLVLLQLARKRGNCWGMEGSTCLLPLLAGTSASQTTTDAEAQRGMSSEMVVVGVDVSSQTVAGRSTITPSLISLLFKY